MHISRKVYISFYIKVKDIMLLYILKLRTSDIIKIIIAIKCSGTSVFDQKIRAKNASEFEQNFGVRTLGLGTEKSQVESKRTPRSISRKRKEPSEAETHSADRFLIETDRILIKEKRKATAQPVSPPTKREREGKKPLKESYPASFRSSMLFRYTFS